jgi:hypothetical protein
MAMTRSAAGAPSEEGIEHAVSLAGAANSLAGYEVSDDVRDLGRHNLCVEMSDAYPSVVGLFTRWYGSPSPICLPHAILRP